MSAKHSSTATRPARHRKGNEYGADYWNEGFKDALAQWCTVHDDELLHPTAECRRGVATKRGPTTETRVQMTASG